MRQLLRPTIGILLLLAVGIAIGYQAAAVGL